jgi:hypothetical protein
MNMDALLTRKQAARRVNVTLAVIDQWLRRGWVCPNTGERRILGTRLIGRTRYVRHGDVLRAERDTRLNPSRSHRRLAYEGDQAA